MGSNKLFADLSYLLLNTRRELIFDHRKFVFEGYSENISKNSSGLMGSNHVFTDDFKTFVIKNIIC